MTQKEREIFTIRHTGTNEFISQTENLDVAKRLAEAQIGYGVDCYVQGAHGRWVARNGRLYFRAELRQS